MIGFLGVVLAAAKVHTLISFRAWVSSAYTLDCSRGKLMRAVAAEPASWMLLVAVAMLLS
jgi:hypothetical protein